MMATPIARCPRCGEPTAWRGCTGDVSAVNHVCGLQFKEAMTAVLSGTLPKPQKRGPKPRTRIKRGKRPKPMRKSTIAMLIQEADDLLRHIVRKRNGGLCERCGVNAGTDTAHGWPRDYYGTRWDRRNVWNLCRFCHEWLGKTRARMTNFMIEKRGIAMAVLLRTKANAITKLNQPDMALLCAHLRRILEDGEEKS